MPIQHSLRPTAIPSFCVQRPFNRAGCFESGFSSISDRRHMAVIPRVCQSPVRALCFLTVATFCASAMGNAQSSQAPLVPVRTINHLQIRVTDLRRSQEFYTRLLGATVIDTTADTWTLMLPEGGVWLS